MAQSVRAFVLQGDWVIESQPRQTLVVKTGPLPNARQQLGVSWVLGEDHYKRISRVTVGEYAKEPLMLKEPNKKILLYSQAGRLMV